MYWPGSCWTFSPDSLEIISCHRVCKKFPHFLKHNFEFIKTWQQCSPPPPFTSKWTVYSLYAGDVKVAIHCMHYKVNALKNNVWMKSLSDVVNDSEDCFGVISSTLVTELFTVFSPREWLFGICTNVTWLQCLILQMIKNGTQGRPRNWARVYFWAKKLLITSFKKGVAMGFFWGWF